MQQFKEKILQILTGENDYELIKNTIEELYAHYLTANPIEAGELTYERGIDTENGWVVGAGQAAHCLKDLMRTTQFLRGIHAAIEDQLKNKPTAEILYAGCGPYATLLTPFTALYSPDQVRFHLLDINETSLEAVRNMYERFGISNFVEKYWQMDATEPFANFYQKFDIILSETMQAGLKRECQVPLTKNLLRFLNPEATFIPQRIQLDVYAVGKKDLFQPDKTEKQLLGTVYALDQTIAQNLDQPVIIDKSVSKYENLMLYTEIQIYKDVWLKPYQSGLTFPLVLDANVGDKPNQMRFWYETGASPEMKFEYLQPN